VVTIVVAGPQASGKTSLALALGDALSVPVLSRDPLIAALLAGYPRWIRRCLRGPVAAAGLRIQTALLARQLELGQSAIVECVAPSAVRQAWRRQTLGAGGRYVAVECVCSDIVVHKARVTARLQSSGGRGVSWRRTQATMRRYQPDPDTDFVADAIIPVAELAAAVASLVRGDC
jgi:hypothetical protein